MDFMVPLIIIVIVLLLLFSTIKVVKEGYAYVIETLGKYTNTWRAGLHFKIPVIQVIANKVSLKEQVADFPPQSVITRDNVMITSDSVVYFRIVDPKLNTYGVQNDIAAIENLTATTLRSIIGDMTLDESLNQRESINAKMLDILDRATDPWGIKVTRVEIKNITPPLQMQETMEAEARAEREKRAKILEAEGIKQAAVTTAQGHKEATILNAEAEKAATILKAEAEKERKIREAEGRAKAIEAEGLASANALKYLKEADADEKVMTLKSLEALQKAANGQSNTIIIPSELQNVGSIVGAIKGIASAAEKTEG